MTTWTQLCLSKKRWEKQKWRHALEQKKDHMMRCCSNANWHCKPLTSHSRPMDGVTVWHDKCVLNAGRCTPPPGLNIVVAFLSVSPATEAHKNCRMCMWPPLLFFGAQQERMNNSFLHGVCSDVRLLACCMDNHWSSLVWEGQLFYTVHSSSWGCHQLHKLSREDESQCHKTCIVWVLAVKCVSSVPSAHVAFMTTKRRAHAPEKLDI